MKNQGNKLIRITLTALLLMYVAPLFGASYAKDHIIIKFKDKCLESGELGPTGLLKTDWALKQLNLPDGCRLDRNKFTRLRHASSPSLKSGRRPLPTHPADLRMLLYLPSWVSVEQILETLKHDPTIEYAEPDYHAELRGIIPDDPDFTRQVNLFNPFRPDLEQRSDIQMPEAWEITTGSEDIIVAVIDTGITSDSPDLAGRILPGYDFDNDLPNPEDDQGHGSWVSHIIAAKGNDGYGMAGINWNCKILPLKVNSLNTGITGSNWTDALDFAIQQGAKVINMSIGTNSNQQAVNNAIRRGLQKGIIMVGGLKNILEDGETEEAINVPGCMGVASLNFNNERTLYTGFGDEVDVVAQGHFTWSRDHYNTPAEVNGTSFAIPQVAGVASLLASLYPAITPRQVEILIYAGAVDMLGDKLDVPGYDKYYGWGRLNAYNTLRLASLGLPDENTDILELRKQLNNLKNESLDIQVPELPSRHLESQQNSAWHRGDITDMKYSPDGSYLATGSQDGTMKIWNTSKPYHHVRTLTQDSPVFAIAFAPSVGSSGLPTWVTAGADGVIRIWDLVHGTYTPLNQISMGPIANMDISPDGHWLAAVDQFGHLAVWNLKTLEMAHNISVSDDYLTTVKFSPNGNSLATGGKTGATLWRFPNLDPIATLTRHRQPVTSLAFYPDGKRIITGSEDKSIHEWNALTGDWLDRWASSRLAGDVFDLILTQDGQWLISTHGDGNIQIWTVSAKRIRKTIEHPSAPIMHLAYDPHSHQFAGATMDHQVKLWNTDTGNKANLTSFHGSGSSAYILRYSPDGRDMASVSRNGSLLVVDAKTLEPKAVPYDDGDNAPTSVGFTHDGKRLIYATMDSDISTVDLTSNKITRTRSLQQNYINHLEISPNDQIVAVTSSKTDILLLSTSTLLPYSAPLEGHDRTIGDVAFTHDSKRLISAGRDTTLKIWDLETGSNLHTLTDHQGAVPVVRVSPDDQLFASGSWDTTVKIWDLETYDLKGTLHDFQSGIMNLDFLADGKILAVVTRTEVDPYIYFYRIETMELLDRIRIFESPSERQYMSDVIFSPDGNQLTVSTRNGAMMNLHNPFPLLQFTSIMSNGTELDLHWKGHPISVQLQTKNNPNASVWSNLGNPTNENPIRAIPNQDTAIYRLTTEH
jgi:WD40 repeat protein